MNIITLPKSPKTIKKEGNLGIFEINDIYPGYGITLANALRRVILSSMPGSAVTSVKFRNVSHEFSTLPNVKEDIVEVILNLKQLRFNLHGDEPVKLFLSVKGEKQVTAGDIKENSQVDVINADAHIATLTSKNAELEMELTIEKGLGYSVVESRDKGKKEIGVIAIDAICSPIRKVGYEIENVRVGQRTDYNKIILEIETDGSISPEEALTKSVEILVQQFDSLKMIEKEGSEKAEEAVPAGLESKLEEKIEAAGEEPVSPEALLQKSIDELDFSVRTVTALKENKLKTVGSIVKKSEADLLDMPKMGKVAVKELKKELGKLGLVLKQ